LLLIKIEFIEAISQFKYDSSNKCLVLPGFLIFISNIVLEPQILIIMKNLKLLSTFFMACLVLTCSNENSLESGSIEIKDPNFRVTENVVENSSSTLNEQCITVNLIAGQHHIAGTVSVNNDGENLVITYSSNSDWTIGLTHLSIGNCDELLEQTTGSGNPQIGHFEHSEEHSDGTNEVVYMISLDALDEYYCFAAHAEVYGPSGEETAWAEGSEFEGNSWAMYVESQLSDCSGGVF